ncbi:MerR family transcriptional regulator [Jongsikchunia kroppenstedtii]|uniref:MerR family transcriptional regulator n=1 Tax=Jongsikchunia kroppenstedtii TaxID=1121721 RepID=UPI00039C0F1A|nr:MerR family transcriptional regulator [Jongsikchunia kroppenstedtii]
MTAHTAPVTIVSIGSFSRMTYLSIKALRHYHELGLLEPAQIDPSSGYRSYDTGQVPTAQVIRRLRELNMPLDEIREVVAADDPQVRNSVIAHHLSRVEKQLAETQATVSGLRNLLEPPPAGPLTFRTLEPAIAVGRTAIVTVDEFAPWWVATFDELLAEIKSAGLTPTGAKGSLYTGDFFERDTGGEVTAFVPCVPDRTVELPSPIELPGLDVATMVHSGSLHELDRTYWRLGSEVANRSIGIDGPIREYYVVGPHETDDESAWRTEVCWPVFRTN